MKKSRKGILLALAAAVNGAAFLMPYKVATGRAPTSGIVLGLLFVAAILNSATSVAQRRVEPLIVDRFSLSIAAIFGSFTVVGNVAMINSLVLIEPGVASVLLQTQVLFVAIMGWPLLDERVNRRFVLGALLAIAGIAVLHHRSDNRIPALSTMGTLWAFLAAFMFGSIQVITRKVIQRIRPVQVNSLRLWLSAAMLACVPGYLHDLLSLERSVWLLIIAAAFFGPLLSRLASMYAVRYIPAALSTLVMMVTPVFAFAFSLALFGHWPSIKELAGGALVIAGVIIPLLRSARSAAALPANLSARTATGDT